MTVHTPAPSRSLPAGLPLLDMGAAAELACVSQRTLHRWRMAGHLPTVRIGRRVMFRRSAVANYLEAVQGTDQTAPPAPAGPSPAEAAQLLTLEDTRAVLGLSASAVAALLRSGELAGTRVHGRRNVRTGDLATFVEEHSHPATAGPLAGRHA